MPDATAYLNSVIKRLPLTFTKDGVSLTILSAHVAGNLLQVTVSAIDSSGRSLPVDNPYSFYDPSPSALRPPEIPDVVCDMVVNTLRTQARWRR